MAKVADICGKKRFELCKWVAFVDNMQEQGAKRLNLRYTVSLK
jgi:hypothetical protein